MSSRSAQVGLGPVLGDLRVEQLVDRAQLPFELGPGPAAAEAAGGEADQLRARRGGFGEDGGEHPPQAVQPRTFGDAEDGPQDHLQRHRLHPRVDRELALQRPGVDLGADDLLHRRLVGEHPLAVEGGQHQAAAGDVVGAFQQQHRARAEDRFEDDVAARRQPVRAVRVEGLDRDRVREQDHWPLEAEEAEAEGLAIALAALLHERQRAEGPAQGLGQGVRARFGRQRHRSESMAGNPGVLVRCPDG